MNDANETIEYIGDDGRVHEVNTGERVEYIPRLVIAHACKLDYNERSRAVPENISQ